MLFFFYLHYLYELNHLIILKFLVEPIYQSNITIIALTKANKSKCGADSYFTNESDVNKGSIFNTLHN